MVGKGESVILGGQSGSSRLPTAINNYWLFPWKVKGRRCWIGFIVSLLSSGHVLISDLGLETTEQRPWAHHSRAGRDAHTPPLGSLLFVLLNKITEDNHLAVVLLNAARQLGLSLVIVIRKAAAASAT